MSARGRRSPDEGSTLPLVIGYAMLALVVVLLATAATALYIERKRLFTLADGAALVGAESFDLTDVTLTPDGPRPLLTDEQVAEAAADYLTRAPVDGFEGLTLRKAHTVDGLSATVTLSAYWRPPVVTLFVPEGLPLEVTAVARSVFD